MKRFYICLAVMAGIVAVCIYSMHRVTQMKERIEVYASAVFAAVEKEDPEETLARVRELAEYWNEEHRTLVRYVRHNQVDEISQAVFKMEAMARYSAFQELSAELSYVLWQAEHIWDSERATLGNIM